MNPNKEKILTDNLTKHRKEYMQPLPEVYKPAIYSAMDDYHKQHQKEADKYCSCAGGKLHRKEDNFCIYCGKPFDKPQPEKDEPYHPELESDE